MEAGESATYQLPARVHDYVEDREYQVGAGAVHCAHNRKLKDGDQGECRLPAKKASDDYTRQNT